MRKLKCFDQGVLDRHANFFGDVDKQLRDLRAELSDPSEIDYLTAIIDFNSENNPAKTNLLVAEAEKLNAFVASFNSEFDVERFLVGRGTLAAKLKVIFNYDRFVRIRGRGASDWGGVRLMETILKNVKYCPYCNSELVYSVKFPRKFKDGSRCFHHLTRSAFDHFYPRSKYPFLGVSIYNLIPACQRCNSGLKGAYSADLTGVAHPYVDDVHEGMKFVPVISSVGTDPENYRTVSEIYLVERTRGGCPKGVQYGKLFGLDHVYSTQYTVEASDAIWKAGRFSKAYVESKVKEWASAGLAKQDVERVLYGAPLNPDEIDRQRLSKLTIDIMKDYRV